MARKPLDISGLSDFERKMGILPKVVELDMDRAIHTSGLEINALQKTLAPRRTGRGVQSTRLIKVQDLGRPAYRLVSGGGDAFYMRFQEFGYAGHSGQAYFFAGYRVLRRRARARHSRTLRASLEKVARS